MLGHSLMTLSGGRGFSTRCQLLYHFTHQQQVLVGGVFFVKAGVSLRISHVTSGEFELALNETTGTLPQVGSEVPMRHVHMPTLVRTEDRVSIACWPMGGHVVIATLEGTKLARMRPSWTIHFMLIKMTERHFHFTERAMDTNMFTVTFIKISVCPNLS